MQKFVKKNIEVQAVQYDGMPESVEELTALGLQYRLREDSSISIITSHGEVVGEIGDYILMSEVTGDFEICNQDKFQKLYSADCQNTVNEQVSVISDSETTSTEKTIEVPESSETDTSEEDKQKCINNLPKSVFGYTLMQLIICTFQLLMIVILPFVMNSTIQKNIKITVESIYQEEIQKESDLLLEKTQSEAELLIEQAKKNAVLEADEAFRKEMERLTNERVKK